MYPNGIDSESESECECECECDCGSISSCERTFAKVHNTIQSRAHSNSIARLKCYANQSVCVFVCVCEATRCRCQNRVVVVAGSLSYSYSTRIHSTRCQRHDFAPPTRSKRGRGQYVSERAQWLRSIDVSVASVRDESDRIRLESNGSDSIRKREATVRGGYFSSALASAYFHLTSTKEEPSHRWHRLLACIRGS